MKPKIFISYKRVDRDKVFRIKERIEQATGQECWIDLNGIESDAQFKNVIINAINNSEIVLFMYSKSHGAITDFEKDWTVRELNFASAKGKRIVFVNIDGSPLTDAFAFDYGTKQQVDARSEEAMTRLCSDINKWLGTPRPNKEERIDTVEPKRRAVTQGIEQKGTINMVVSNAIAILFFLYAKIAGQRAFHGADDVAAFLSVITFIILIVGFANPYLLRLKERKTVNWYFIALFFYLLSTGCLQDNNNAEQEDLTELKEQITFNDRPIKWAEDITKDQLLAVQDILNNMMEVYGDSIRFSAFETTVKEYHTILGESYDKSEASLPIANISFGEAILFIQKLNSLINNDKMGIEFSLPTKDEWEYAASEGNISDSVLYSGSNHIKEVAWFNENSEGKPHPADGQNQLRPNGFNLFDMSGNVSEFTFTPYHDVNNPTNVTNMMLVKGGNYASTEDECRIKYEIPMGTDLSSPKVGIRLVLRKTEN